MHPRTQLQIRREFAVLDPDLDPSLRTEHFNAAGVGVVKLAVVGVSVTAVVGVFVERGV